MPSSGSASHRAALSFLISPPSRRTTGGGAPFGGAIATLDPPPDLHKIVKAWFVSSFARIEWRSVTVDRSIAKRFALKLSDHGLLDHSNDMLHTRIAR